jgi:hypothetical protein
MMMMMKMMIRCCELYLPLPSTPAFMRMVAIKKTCQAPKLSSLSVVVLGSSKTILHSRPLFLFVSTATTETVDLTMSVPTLTDLIVFNTTLKHANTDLSGRLSLVDKEDYDEVSQVLFADGTGLRNSKGETEWNAVLRQMGLAKGLMGFMK